MTPREKLIETMARAYLDAADCTDILEYGEGSIVWEETVEHIEAALRAAENKLHVTVCPNEATERMARAADGFVSRVNAAIAASPYRREG